MSKNAVNALLIGIGSAERISIARIFIILAGDHTAGFFLEEVAYWSNHFKKKAETPEQAEGWFYRTHENWLQRTYLTGEQVMRCVKTCARLGVEYSKMGLPARGHYRFDPHAFLAAHEAYESGMSPADIRAGKHLTSDGQSHSPVEGKAHDWLPGMPFTGEDESLRHSYIPAKEPANIPTKTQAGAAKTAASPDEFPKDVPHVPSMAKEQKRLPDMRRAQNRISADALGAIAPLTGDVQSIENPTGKAAEHSTTATPSRTSPRLPPKELRLAPEDWPKLTEIEGFPAAWRDWRMYRIEKKKPLTETTIKHQLRMLAKSDDPVDMILHTIERGWEGLRERDRPTASRQAQASQKKADSELFVNDNPEWRKQQQEKQREKAKNAKWISKPRERRDD